LITPPPNLCGPQAWPSPASGVPPPGAGARGTVHTPRGRPVFLLQT
jgi:hypothetical protein